MTSEAEKACLNCKGEGWVCEEHPTIPWDGGDQQCCGGAGAPCPLCNPCDADNPPTMPQGFVTRVTRNGDLP